MDVGHWDADSAVVGQRVHLNFISLSLRISHTHSQSLTHAHTQITFSSHTPHRSRDTGRLVTASSTPL